MENTIESTEKALAEGNVYAIPDSLLTFNLEFRDHECSRLLGKIVSYNLKTTLSIFFTFISWIILNLANFTGWH